MRASADPNTLGDVIRRRRLQFGWSQEELAARASAGDDDVRQSDISRLELGKVGLPRRARLQRIAAALEMPLSELLIRSGWAVNAMSPAMPEPEFRPSTDPARRDPVERRETATGRPAATAAFGAAGPNVRLQDAIAEARLTMARSAAAIDRARAIYDMVAHPPNRRRGRRGASDGGSAS